MLMHVNRDSVTTNLSVCPSVCHTLVGLLYLTERICRQIFPPSSRDMTLVFERYSVTKFQEELPHRSSVRYTGRWENLAVFDRNRRLSRKRYEIGPWLLWITNSKPWADRSVSIPVSLSDLERRDARGQFFSGGSPIITLMWFDLEWQNLAG